MSKKKKIVDVALIIPDASPVLTLARIDRLDLLLTFNAPIKIVDQVHFETTKPQNDPEGRVKAFFGRMGNQVDIVETNVGVGFQTRRARDPKTPSSNLGEDAVSEYARNLARTMGPSFVPLVLFEDPDVLTLPVANLVNVHLLNTTGWLTALEATNIIPDARQLIDRINAGRKTPMRPYDRPARTKKLRSTFLKKSSTDAQD
jgi:hypothetical protein